MKKRVLFLVLSIVLGVFRMTGQTYVNEMLRSQVEADCYIEGGGVVYNDEGPGQYNDLSYVQKASAEIPTSFIFNRDVCGNNNLTGLKINMLLRKEDNPDVYIKIEYSTNEINYLAIPDMHIDFTYDEAAGAAYWYDVFYQAALPAGAREIKVTLLAKPDDANWIPCYRRTELFYNTGTPYSYVIPPNIVVPVEYAETFSVDFENTSNYIVSTSGSENPSSSVEVVENPKKDGVNGSNNVLKLTQVPSTPEEWGWGNGDWFGTSIAANDGSNLNQMTKITESNKYLHFSIYRTNDVPVAMETWGGSAALKEQRDFVATAGWKTMVIDLTDYIGGTFDAFYFSPNTLFQTNAVQSTEISYMDNIFLAATIQTGLKDVMYDDVKITGQKAFIRIDNAIGKKIEIFNLTGTLVQKSLVASNQAAFPLNPGIYIVKVENQVSKIVVF
jgi:hypothetical protein